MNPRARGSERRQHGDPRFPDSAASPGGTGDAGQARPGGCGPGWPRDAAVVDPEERRVRVAVLDDDPGVLRSIGRLLRKHGFDVIPFSSPKLLLAEVASLEPACLVIDLSMPELSGLDVQRALSDRGLTCPMVFVTGHGDIRTSVQAMRGGAVDFLTKPFDAAELLGALQRACAASQDARTRDSQQAELRQKAATLTARERQVLEQVVTGLLNKQIAANLSISEKTVKVHRGRVMRKMSARSVVQLVRAAEQLGICGIPC